MGAAAKAELKLKYAWLVLIPAAALILAEATIGLLAQQPLEIPVSDACESLPLREAAARLELLSLVSLYLLFAAVLFGKFLRDMAVLFDWRGRGVAGAVLGVCAAIGLVFILAAYGLDMWAVKRELFTTALFDAAFAEAETYGSDVVWGGTMFLAMLCVTMGLSVLAVAAAVAGGITCLAERPDGDPIENWVQQAERLRTYIYMGAGILIVGVLFVKAWAAYPGYLLCGDAGEAYASLVDAFTMFTGVEYSVVLAAAAIPTAMILSARAQRFAAQSLTGGGSAPAAAPSRAQIQQERAKHKLIFSAQDVLKTVAALLAPFLTGAIANLTTVLG